MNAPRELPRVDPAPDAAPPPDARTAPTAAAATTMASGRPAAAALPVRLHQIAWSAPTLAAIEPGWEVLDNTDNPRPDWYEYWPIRRRLFDAFAAPAGTAAAFDDEGYVGFFSPKFRAKTGLGADAVRETVRRAAVDADADVVLFSPQPDMGAFFLNVFEQGEVFDPGLIAATEDWLASIGRPASLSALVMDARQVVFSNYFVARPAFWREWLGVCETLFALCERGGPTPLRAAMVQPTTYPGSAQRKVFVVERVASLLLTTQPRWRSVAANPFDFAWSASRLREHPTEAVISNALKHAWRDLRCPQYLDAFAQIRQRFLSGERGASGA